MLYGIWAILSLLVTIEAKEVIFECLRTKWTDRCMVKSLKAAPGDQIIYSGHLNSSYMTVSDSHLPEIPANLFRTYIDLTHFHAASSGIQDLHNFTFDGAKRLFNMDLRRNNLTRIAAGPLFPLVSLEVLHLSNNQISEIDEEAFATLYELIELNLESNRLKHLTDGTFKKCPRLDILRLSNNQLEEINGRIFSSNFNLKWLVLASNRIKKVHESAFIGTFSELDLSKNRIKSFSGRRLKAIFLDISDNEIETLTLGPGNVEFFHAGRNRIHKIISDGMAVIGLLEMPYNRISDVSWVSKLRGLYSMNLMSNNLTEIGEKTFLELKGLTSLNLRDNQIKFIHPEAFAPLVDLEFMDLSDNQLREVNLVTKKGFLPKLERINIQNNNWNCSYLAHLDGLLMAAKIHYHMTSEYEERYPRQEEIRGVGCRPDKWKY